MRSRPRCTSSLLALLLVGVMTCQAIAAPVIMRKGEVALEDGIFLPGMDAMEVGTILSGTGLEAQERAILDRLVTDLKKQLTESQSSMAACKTSLELQAELQRVKDEIIAHLRGIIVDYKGLLADARTQFAKDSDTIKRLEERIGKLENKLFWATLTAPLMLILGAAITWFGGGLLK